VSTEFKEGVFGDSDVNVSDAVLVKFELLLYLQLLSGDNMEKLITFWKCSIDGHSACLITKERGHYKICREGLEQRFEALVSEIPSFRQSLSKVDYPVLVHIGSYHPNSSSGSHPSSRRCGRGIRSVR